MNISFQTSSLCPCMNSAPSYSKTLTILRQILIFILCELFMFASDFHQIETSIIKSVRPSFISSYEWKSQKSKFTLFSAKILALHLYAKLTSDESKFLWKQVMPQVAKRVSQRKFTKTNLCSTLYLFQTVFMWKPWCQPQYSDKCSIQGGGRRRAGQGRRDGECTNTNILQMTTDRYICTSRVCPMRWHLSCAWASMVGFQSLS